MHLPIPENKTDLQQSLGLESYVGKLIVSSSKMTAALR